MSAKPQFYDYDRYVIKATFARGEVKTSRKMAGAFSKLQLFNIDCSFNLDDCGWVMHDRRMVIVGVGLCVGGLYLLNRYVQSKQKQLESRQEALCNFPSLWGHTNLMSKHLTPELYVQLRNKRTKCGFSLDSAIQPGTSPQFLFANYTKSWNGSASRS